MQGTSFSIEKLRSAWVRHTVAISARNYQYSENSDVNYGRVVWVPVISWALHSKNNRNSKANQFNPRRGQPSPAIPRSWQIGSGFLPYKKWTVGYWSPSNSWTYQWVPPSVNEPFCRLRSNLLFGTTYTHKHLSLRTQSKQSLGSNDGNETMGKG